MITKGFDNATYLHEQTREILERTRMFGNKLYLEFGGKLLHDYHAARVLPGYDPDVKMHLLQQLRDTSEIVLCVCAGDIVKRKTRGDLGITYDDYSLKLIDDMTRHGLWVSTVVLTRYIEHPLIRHLTARLENKDIRVVRHYETRGYPADIDLIVSDEGYGANAWFPTTRPLVVLTGPGPGSGKLATCLTQLYHDSRSRARSGYAKFETFPVWDLPIKHLLNVAYESATADLRDVNMIDPYHLDAYGITAVNYNRDIEAFPLLRSIWEKITRSPCPYKSPTDMGVNRIRAGITDDALVAEAARQEIIRRYFLYAGERLRGTADDATVDHARKIMLNQGFAETDRPVVQPARAAAADCRLQRKGHDGIYSGAAIRLRDGRIVTGKNSPLMHAGASTVLNAVKVLARIPDSVTLLSPAVLNAVIKMKGETLQRRSASLNLDEMLIALAICSAEENNAPAAAALTHLRSLRKCEMHLTHLPTPGDEAGLRRLALRYTCDPEYASHDLYIE